MATNDSTVTDREAAAAVLSKIAGDLFSAAEVLLDAVQADGSKDALIMAARALVTESGMLADRTARACGDPRIQGDEEWILAPSTRAALQTLEGSGGARTAAS